MKEPKVKIKVPDNLKKDLINIVSRQNIMFPYNIDGFLYVVNKIVQLSLNNRKYQRLKKVPLYSKILRRELGKHYKRYLEFLIENGFIETDDHYVVSSDEAEGKCKCYGLKSKYRKGKLIDHEVTYKSLLHKIIEWRKEYLGKNVSDEMLNKLYGMLQTFSIDIDGATTWLQSMRDKGEISENMMQIELDKCKRINSKDESDLSLFITKDNYNRVHTNITNLSKTIREQFLYMNGKKAIGIDIVSSQAALLYTLFSQQLTKLKEHSQKTMFELLDMNQTMRVDVRQKYVNQKNGYSGPNIYDGRLNDSIPQVDNKTLPEIIAACEHDLAKYKRVLQCEGLYEFFQDRWDFVFSESKTRKFMKNQWITYVFGRGKNKLTANMHQLWEIEFPNLTMLLNHLKDGDYKALSHTLQRTEADLIFNKVCPRIDSEFDVSYCTVHDSVIVPEEMVDDIACLFDEILEENGVVTGVAY